MKFFVKNFGCSANIAEGEIIRGILKKKHILSEEKKADLIIINICTVKGENTPNKQIKKTKKTNPSAKIIITGCITKKLQKNFPNNLFVSTHNIEKILDAVQKNQNFTKLKFLEKLDFPRLLEKSSIGIIPISSGCPDNCSYCSTKHIKGKLQSFSENKIINEAKNFISQDCRELWITAQDTTCYGFDKNTNLAELLEKIVYLDGDFFIRIGMGHPRHLKKYWKNFVDILKHPKVFKFLHLPIQSGSNRILNLMKRNDTAEQFVKIIQNLRNEIPDITISTDIIVGFPSETETDFEASLELIKKIKPDVLNISRFIKRDGTPAFYMPDQVHGKIKKQRSRILTELHRKIALEQHKKWLGWTGEIIIDEKGKDDVFFGRNFAYRLFLVKGNFKLGEKIKVRVVEAKTHLLMAELSKQHS